MSRHHPYLGVPDYQLWKNEPGIRETALFDPVVRPSFRIDRADPIVTAGSCFAQHVAKHLAKTGFNFHVTEKAHPVFSSSLAAAYNYGVFSARYGNVYTARQLRQLLERAYGLFDHVGQSWAGRTGSVLDPFRPQIQPQGFSSEEELVLDRFQHFAAIRDAVEQMSVFVFTLGLTEAWMDLRDGAVFPLAPGVVGGTYDPAIHKFKNFSCAEVVEDMRWSLDFIRSRNPDVKVLITVSPVPLNATALDRHVTVSTAYSKAVLRVAAEEICGSYERCDYFPSYEVITSPVSRASYFAEDCRSVTEAGVGHVMRLVLKHYGDLESVKFSSQQDDIAVQINRDHVSRMNEVVEVLCDEEQITNVERKN